MMNDTPTRGPMITSITQNEREVMSSRHSFLKSHFQALRESKENLLEIGRQRVTHPLLRSSVRAALASIATLPFVRSPPRAISVIDEEFE